jgi:chromosomal replication initiation ATPase DnaA
MSSKPSQIPLDFAPEPDLGAQSFQYASSNAEARRALARSNWANNTLAIVGPKGCGKTHLGNIWANENQAISLNGLDLFAPKKEWMTRALWIDNAASADEYTLFTLINMAITGELKALLLSDIEPPASWDVQIPDLHSRLRNVQIARIVEPDDNLLTSIMLKIFKDRGLKVSDSLISFLLTNTERSVGALRNLIIEIDEAAAIEKVNVTRSFASKYLQRKLL